MTDIATQINQPEYRGDIKDLFEECIHFMEDVYIPEANAYVHLAREDYGVGLIITEVNP